MCENSKNEKAPAVVSVTCAYRSAMRSVFLVAFAGMLCGCTAIPLRRLEPSVTSFGPPCSAAPARSEQTTNAGATEFSYELPPAISALHSEATAQVQHATVEQNYINYKQQMRRSKDYLPPSIRSDAVTEAFVGMMTKVSAKAQVEAAYSGGILNDAERNQQNAIIEKSSLPKKLTHRQLKTFADRLFDTQLRPEVANVETAVSAQAGQPTTNTNEQGKTKAFVVYFRAYYEGQFVSKLGESISKPKLSATIPDSEIATAETVLLEFLLDLVDRTPVLGDTDEEKDAKTFYPGGSSKPTALTTDPPLAKYTKIKSSGCGVTIDNYKYLVDLANGAGDRAATVGGLVANTAGGVSIGLGILGKISIGDNQTLSTLAKTAASELAVRAAYAAAYAAMEHIDVPVP